MVKLKCKANNYGKNNKICISLAQLAADAADGGVDDGSGLSRPARRGLGSAEGGQGHGPAGLGRHHAGLPHGLGHEPGRLHLDGGQGGHQVGAPTGSAVQDEGAAEGSKMEEVD